MDVFGGPVETPNMQRIADIGVKFANFHTTALCSPTRSSLLTGRNATSNGMATIAEFSAGFPGISTRIPFENGFISEVLAERGYNTYCVGKWHLTPGRGVQPRRVQGPLAARARLRAVLRVPRWRVEPVVSRSRPGQQPDRSAGDARRRLPPVEGSRRPGDRLIQSTPRSIDPDKPFFMYLAPGCGHAPHHVFTEWSDKYKGKFDQGYEAIRAGILDTPEGARAPARRHRAVADQPARRARAHRSGRSALAAARHRAPVGLAQRRRAAAVLPHGGGVRRVRVVHRRPARSRARLPRGSGQLDNTLVVVVSDNGASGEGGPNGSFNEWRFFNGVADTTETTLPHIDELGTPKSYNHYCTGWAWAFDTPFPYWKRWAGYEGGVADMCMVAWPAQIKASTEVAPAVHPRGRHRPDRLRPARHRAARR